MNFHIFRFPFLLLLIADSLVAATSDDHLVSPWPDSLWGVPGYSALLQKKLFVTRADYGRVIVLQSFTGECGLSVYQSGANRASVTYTKADEDLWQQRSRALYAVPKDPADKRQIHISRVDASLPVSTAVAIRDAWAAMLRRIAPYRTGSGPIVVDGTYIEFSLEVAHKTLNGSIIPGMRWNNTGEMANIAYMLKAYCTALPSQKSKLATRIETRAKRLARSLDTRQRQDQSGR